MLSRMTDEGGQVSLNRLTYTNSATLHCSQQQRFFGASRLSVVHQGVQIRTYFLAQLCWSVGRFVRQLNRVTLVVTDQTDQANNSQRLNCFSLEESFSHYDHLNIFGREGEQKRSQRIKKQVSECWVGIKSFCRQKVTKQDLPVSVSVSVSESPTWRISQCQDLPVTDSVRISQCTRSQRVGKQQRCQLRQLHLPRCDQTAVDQPENGLNGPDPGRLFTGQQSTGQHVPHSFRAAALNTQPVTLATEPHATFHTYLLFYILTPTIFLNHHKIDTV